jgi:uncharacterized protein
MDIITSIIIFLFAIVMELIDSALGMMYGTILSPVLLLLGFSPQVVVPSVVFSQAIGGFIATIRHNKLKNSDFSGLTRDTKVVLAVVIPGLLACALGVYFALNIPSFWYNLYLGILVITMGFLCIRPIMYKFEWWKIYLVGIIASINKAMSGGGFGPVTSTGKILGGMDAKVSVATTTFAEVPICIASFIIWWILKGSVDWYLPALLSVASAVGGLIGPYITFKFDTKWLKIIVGGLAIVSGLLVLILQKST